MHDRPVKKEEAGMSPVLAELGVAFALANAWFTIELLYLVTAELRVHDACTTEG